MKISVAVVSKSKFFSIWSSWNFFHLGMLNQLALDFSNVMLLNYCKCFNSNVFLSNVEYIYTEYSEECLM